MYDKEVMKMMKEWLAKLALVVFIVSMIVVAINTMPQHKNYHCHSKNFHLYESIEANGNVFLKTKKECIDIRNIKERK